jgi:hypothetical protein
VRFVFSVGTIKGVQIGMGSYFGCAAIYQPYGQQRIVIGMKLNVFNSFDQFVHEGN